MGRSPIRYVIPALSILSSIAILGLSTNRSVGEHVEGPEGFAKCPAGVRTKRIAAVKDGTGPVRLIPFKDPTGAYILEIGGEYLRFFRNGAPVLSGGVPYELPAPWDANDVFGIEYAQDDENAQAMRLKHPDYPAYALTRNSPSHTDWTLTKDSTHEK